MIKHLEQLEDFEKEIKGKLVIVDFFATWCGPCQMLTPNLEQLDRESDVEIVKIDTDEFPEIARQFGIMSIPTLMLFKEGKLVKRDLGYKSIEDLRNFIN